MSSISEFMLQVLLNYDSIRGKHLDSKTSFWDAVVISASDENQEDGFKQHISEKEKRKELPLAVPFHVFADPPGFKIGCGGSTMYVLEKLLEIYESEMHSMRFLFIPAGGYSQRLPNLSVIGKLFSPLPFKGARYQMLDLILACYVPFLKRMPPGVLLVSSDAIISYSLSDTDTWTFENGGFTALAHPSSVTIGTNHGVYVLPANQIISDSTFMSECLRVLQKPTVEELKDKGAIIKGDLLGSENEMVFTDSAFFFDHTISKKLVNFYKKHKPLKCELSSYGDFLQPLGSGASPYYIMNKVTSETLAKVQSALYAELFETNISIMVMRDSNFHHLGTMREYLQTLCCENEFSGAFPVSRFSLSAYSIPSLAPLFIKGTVVHSVVHPCSVLPKSSIVEYSNIEVAMSIGANCILSGIQLPGVMVQRFPHPIPENVLFHTVILKDGFVTIAFGIEDNIKLAHSDVPEMRYFGNRFRNFLRREDPIFSKSEVSLWTANLFPVCPTPHESFKRTVEIVWSLLEGNLNYTLERKDSRWVSMGDILSMKDTQGTISYLDKLLTKISPS